MKQSIIIVEDDVNINNLVKDALEKEGYDCKQAFSGTEAVLCLKMEQFDLMLLDLMLPGISGEDVLKQLRKQSEIPVIVLSAKDELDSKVGLLICGADDYLTKPFEIKELIARVAVCLRRSKKNGTNNDTDNQTIVHKELSLNKQTFEVYVCKNALNLTKQEFKILELLMTYPNKVFSKQDIYDYAWEDYFIGEDKTINVHISNIRLKLKKYTDDNYIDTVWGIGFKLSK